MVTKFLQKFFYSIPGSILDHKEDISPTNINEIVQYALKYENLTFEQTRASAKHLVDGKSTLWSKIIPRML